MDSGFRVPVVLSYVQLEVCVRGKRGDSVSKAARYVQTVVLCGMHASTDSYAIPKSQSFLKR